MSIRIAVLATMACVLLPMSAEAASPYVKCVQKVQKKHKTISRVIPLDGVSKGLPLDKRADAGVLTSEQSGVLSVAFEELLECRQKALRRASDHPDALAIMNDVFGKFDIVYVDLQQGRVPIGIASVALVNMRKDAEVAIKRIEARIDAQNAEQARKNSADGWKLMQQGIDMMYPPDAPTNPTYTCRDYGGYTRCTPSQ